MLKAPLLPFTSSPFKMNVEVRREQASFLRLDYFLKAEQGDVVLPQAGQGKRRDELWKTTCFELFLKEEGAQAYYELNFSPSGDWAIFHFDGYREGMASPEVAKPPGIKGRWEDGLYHLGVKVSLSDFSGIEGRSLKAGLCAVVEEQSGTRSYWALNHSGEKPDFHHSDCFHLNLGPEL